MPVTREQVTDALRPVQDPELNRSIVELDMVRDVTIDGAAVTVLIALTVAGCPLRAEITSRVTNAVGALAGVERVAVEMTVMTDEERAALKVKLGQGGHSHAGHDHGGQPAARKPIPFNEPGVKTRVLGIA